MNKKLLVLGLFAVFVLLTACENNKVQPTFVPSVTVAPTKAGTPTDAATATPSPTPTPRLITPVPTQAVADGSDFLEILRLLSPGTVVDIEGAGKEAIERCFYVEELNYNEKAIFGENSYLESEINELQKLRLLYYGSDGRIYVGEIYANRTLVADLLDNFKAAYDNKNTFTSFTASVLSKTTLIGELQIKTLNGKNRDYLYLYK